MAVRPIQGSAGFSAPDFTAMNLPRRSWSTLVEGDEQLYRPHMKSAKK